MNIKLTQKGMDFFGVKEGFYKLESFDPFMGYREPYEFRLNKCVSDKGEHIIALSHTLQDVESLLNIGLIEIISNN